VADLKFTEGRLERVLGLNGPEFLAQAYLLVLGRPVDPEGFRTYEAQLRSGASKLAILAALASSPEGQSRGVDAASFLDPSSKTEYAPVKLRCDQSTNSCVDVEGNSVTKNVSALLALDDGAFIQGAYNAVLKRAPDSSGFSHYLYLLRSGTSKMRILRYLILSAEGREVGASLPGLKRALRRYWLANNPITGWWYRPITQVESDTPLECRVRAVESALTRLLQKQEMESVALDNSAAEVVRMLKALATRRSA
jgi:hypothetical protein